MFPISCTEESAEVGQSRLRAKAGDPVTDGANFGSVAP
jgi:hypothetical protein